MWELEVGQTVAPDQGLPETISPDGFDDPNTLAAFVDAVRWGAVTSADGNAFQAPFRSGANVEAYQLEPLRRALQSARTNLLLADDVGLGKTIEAGLVIAGAAAAAPCPVGRHRVPAEPVAEVAGRDAGEVRPGIRDRQQRADGEGAAHPRAEREPVPAVPPGDRVDGVAAVAARPAAAARRCTPTCGTPAARAGTRSTCSSWTRRTTSRPRARPPPPGSAATRSTASGRSPPGSWPKGASTGCSCPRPRTTATPSRSPR